MNKKENSCNLCGSKNLQKFLEKNENSIVKCQNCGLLFVNPQPSQEELNKLYQKQYFKADFSQKNIVGYKDYIGNQLSHTCYFTKKLNQIMEHKKRGKILDIGCAVGFFLETAKKAGFECYGVDISKFAVDCARKNFNLNVYHGHLEEIKFPSDMFDVVTLFQVIEHVKYPLKLLKEVKRILKPKGLLILTTPDNTCLSAKILGRYWWGYAYKTHLFIFNPKTINFLLEKSGFRDIKIEQNFPIRFSIEDALIRIRILYGWQFAKELLNIFSLFSPFLNWKFISLSAGVSVKATR